MFLWNYIVHVAHPTPWNITGHSTIDNGVLVDWTGFPGDKNINFFVISVNQTTINQYNEHDDDEENKPLRILQIVNSSRTSVNIKKLPVSVELVVTVYLVDKDDEIFQSEIIIFKTKEGGKWYLFYYFLLFMLQVVISKYGHDKFFFFHFQIINQF